MTKGVVISKMKNLLVAVGKSSIIHCHNLFFKVLLDGPASGVLRSVRNLKDLQLTKFKVPIRLQQRTKNVEKAWTEAEISKKWQESTWAKKLAARKLVRLLFSLKKR